eukprot:jgi/Botrbrau1/2774/Bobra.0164s0051.1
MIAPLTRPPGGLVITPEGSTVMGSRCAAKVGARTPMGWLTNSHASNVPQSLR